MDSATNPSALIMYISDADISLSWILGTFGLSLSIVCYTTNDGLRIAVLLRKRKPR